jgi:hypothetical protein
MRISRRESECILFLFLTRNAFIGIKNSVVFEQLYSDLKEINDKMSKIERS